MFKIEELKQKAEKLAVEIIRNHIEVWRLVWAEHHARQKDDSVTIRRVRHERLDIEVKIEKLEAELNAICAELALFFANNEERSMSRV